MPRLTYLRGHSTPITLVLGLLIAASFLGRIGVEDVSGAITYLGRLAGALMLLAAGVTLIAAIAVFDYWGQENIKFSGAAVLLGALTVLITNLMMLAVQIQGGDYTLFLAVWTGLSLWAVWALWILLHKRRVWRSIPAPRGFAIGLLVTGLIAIANFTYSQIYIPYANPGAVEATVDFGKPVARAGGGTLVPLRFHLKNLGKESVYVVTSSFLVWGETAYPSDVRGPAEWMKDVTDNSDIQQNLQSEGSALLETGTFTGSGEAGWLDPGVTWTTEKTIELNKGTPYRAVLAQGEIVTARKDRVVLEPVATTNKSWNSSLMEVEKAPKWVTEKAYPFRRDVYRLIPSSAVLNITRNPKYLTTWWVLNPNYPILQWTVAPKGGETRKPTNEERLAWTRRYGLENDGTGTSELLLAGLPGQQ